MATVIPQWVPARDGNLDNLSDHFRRWGAHCRTYYLPRIPPRARRQLARRRRCHNCGASVFVPQFGDGGCVSFLCRCCGYGVFPWLRWDAMPTPPFGSGDAEAATDE
jgi:hypothetical protein